MVTRNILESIQHVLVLLAFAGVKIKLLERSRLLEM